MATVHRLSRQDARRIAVRAQLLDASRASELLDVIRHLTVLQYDQTSSVAPSADLVLWSRLGSSYAAADLRAAIAGRSVIDLRGMIRPAEDISLFRAEMAAWPGAGEVRPYLRRRRDWVAANDACRRDLLGRLGVDGPSTARELPDTCVQPFASSGWNNNRNVTMMLEFMEQRGEVAVSGRAGRDRLWDLAERVYLDLGSAAIVPVDEAIQTRNRRRLQSLGIARANGPECPVEPSDVADAGALATIDGVRGEWRVDPEQLAQLGRPFRGRAALLSPFDRLLHDRAQMRDIFEFDYALEMYKPAVQRRWGYYALPVLYGDQLVGKLDAKADRAAGGLRIDAVHQDVPFTVTMAAEIDAEITALADWVACEIDAAAALAPRGRSHPR